MLYVRRRERAGRDKNRTLFLGRFSYFEVAKSAEGAPWYAEIDPSARTGLIRYLDNVVKKRAAADISPVDEHLHQQRCENYVQMTALTASTSTNVGEGRRTHRSNDPMHFLVS